MRPAASPGVGPGLLARPRPLAFRSRSAAPGVQTQGLGGGDRLRGRSLSVEVS